MTAVIVILMLSGLMLLGMAAYITLAGFEDGRAREAAEFQPDLRNGILRWVNFRTAEVLSADEYVRRYAGISYHPSKKVIEP